MAFGAIGSVAEAIMNGPEGDYASMSIAGINPVTQDIMLPERTFQYWPSAISDSIQIGWNFKDIPGMQAALAQWSSNGGRTVSFEVHLSRFMKPVSSRTKLERVLDPFSLNTPSSQHLKDNRPYNVDIVAEVKYLRAFDYSSYKDINGYRTSYPPPIAMLNIPGLRLDDYTGGDVVWAAMTGCDINYTLLFPDGTPRKATVSLIFRLINQNPDDKKIYNPGFNQDPEFDYNNSKVWNSTEEPMPAPGGGRLKNDLDGWW